VSNLPHPNFLLEKNTFSLKSMIFDRLMRTDRKTCTMKNTTISQITSRITTAKDGGEIDHKRVG